VHLHDLQPKAEAAHCKKELDALKVDVRVSNSLNEQYVTANGQLLEELNSTSLQVLLAILLAIVAPCTLYRVLAYYLVIIAVVSALSCQTTLYVHWHVATLVIIANVVGSVCMPCAR
jgi:sensor domain CHASE-containing protein